MREEGNELRQKMTEGRSKCGKMRETGKEENVGGEEKKNGIWHMERMDSGDVEGEGDLKINERMKERMRWKERMGEQPGGMG